MKPCATCPFRRSVTPGALGGSPTPVFVGQVHAPFHIPCHSHIDYSDPDWRVKAIHVPHCAGAALFRANLHLTHLPKRLVSKTMNTVEVFATVNQFVAHHQGCRESEVQHPTVNECVRHEFSRAGITHYQLSILT